MPQCFGAHVDVFRCWLFLRGSQILSIDLPHCEQDPSQASQVSPMHMFWLYRYFDRCTLGLHGSPLTDNVPISGVKGATTRQLTQPSPGSTRVTGDQAFTGSCCRFNQLQSSAVPGRRVVLASSDELAEAKGPSAEAFEEYVVM